MKYLQYEYKPNIRDNRIMIIASSSEKIKIMLLLQVICRYSIDIPYQHFFPKYAMYKLTVTPLPTDCQGNKCWVQWVAYYKHSFKSLSV